MPEKEIRQAIFYDDARVKSELLDPQGLPIQRMNMLSSELHYDVIPPDPKTAKPGDEPNKRITIPVPGKMLVEDYSPPSTQPAKTQDANSGPMGGMNGRGATAFQWQKSLVYDDATNRVTMDGSVVVDHRDLDVKKGALEEESMHITGERLIADIESPAEAAARTAAALKASTQPTTKPAAPQRQMKNVVVLDHVHVTMKNGELTADHINYNPQTKVLIAYGTPERDAVFMRAEAPATQDSKRPPAGMQPIRAQQLQWDSGADLPTIIQGGGTFRR
jgi:lipopolysaccharide export system protein LptA